MARDELIEAMARATCEWDGSDPDEIMPDGKPRWRDRVESVSFLFGPALEAQGFAIVPTYPTESMVVRGIGWREYDLPDDWPDEWRVPYGTYRAMIAAAQEQAND